LWKITVHLVLSVEYIPETYSDRSDCLPLLKCRGVGTEMTIALFRISLYIYDIRSLAFDPYMCFLRYPTSWHISKGREVKDLILTTLSRESGQHQCEVVVFFALLRRGFVLWCPLWFPHSNNVRFVFTM
jgi:hypothetical protein